MRAISNIFWLGTKEIRSFLRDWVSGRADDLGIFNCRHRPSAEQFARAA